MQIERVGRISRCAECEAIWSPADQARRRAYLGGDDFDEPAEVVCYWPECAKREFGER